MGCNANSPSWRDGLDELLSLCEELLELSAVLVVVEGSLVCIFFDDGEGLLAVNRLADVVLCRGKHLSQFVPLVAVARRCRRCSTYVERAWLFVRVGVG